VGPDKRTKDDEGYDLEQQAALDEIARLEALMEGDAGAGAFAALAEANRRAGRVKQAEQVARDGLRHRPDFVAGRVALSLALLDLGRLDEARTELRRVLDMVPDHTLAASALGSTTPSEYAALGDIPTSAGPLSDLAEDELESAFEGAEAQADEMLSANRVVEAAVRDIEKDEPEGVETFDVASPFATPTVADLLERQNHGEQARALRESIERSAAPEGRAADPGGSLPDALYDRARVRATLERWLENLRRGSR
jgi:tetratricopeptide (TPR) repeat protein